MDTRDIVANAVADAVDVAPDSGDVGSDGGEITTPETSTEVATAAGGETVTPAVEDPTEAEFTKDFGFSKFRSDKKENRIPYSDVVRITKTKEKKIIGEIAQSLGIDAKDIKTLAEFSPRLKSVLDGHGSTKTKLDELTKTAESWQKAQEIATNNPEGYIRALSQLNPAYSRFLAPQPPQEYPSPVPQPFKLPEPTYDLGNGQKTYSVEDLQTAIMSAIDEGERRAVAKAEQKFKPILDNFNTNAEREAAKGRLQQMHNSLVQQFGQPYSDNYEAIAKIAMDRQISLNAAFHAFEAESRSKTIDELNKKLETQRAEILAEIAKTPTSTAMATSGGTSKASTGPKTTRDIIAAQVAARRG